MDDITYPLVFINEEIKSNWSEFFFSEEKVIKPTQQQKIVVKETYYSVILLIFTVAICQYGFWGVVAFLIPIFIFISEMRKNVSDNRYAERENNKRYKTFREEMELYYKRCEEIAVIKRELKNDKINDLNRWNKISEIMHSATKPEVTSIQIKTGIVENEFQKKLDLWFPNKIHRNLALGNYIPDFTYWDKEINLLIDIEIDEPYTYDGHTVIPIHQIGYYDRKGNYIQEDVDERRNDFFLYNGWIVIRFAELQVISQPEECCELIDRFITRLKNGKKNEPDYNTALNRVKQVIKFEMNDAIASECTGFRDEYLRKQVKPIILTETSGISEILSLTTEMDYCTCTLLNEKVYIPTKYRNGIMVSNKVLVALVKSFNCERYEVIEFDDDAEYCCRYYIALMEECDVDDLTERQISTAKAMANMLENSLFNKLATKSELSNKYSLPLAYETKITYRATDAILKGFNIKLSAELTATAKQK